MDNSTTNRLAHLALVIAELHTELQSLQEKILELIKQNDKLRTTSSAVSVADTTATLLKAAKEEFALFIDKLISKDEEDLEKYILIEESGCWIKQFESSLVERISKASCSNASITTAER